MTIFFRHFRVFDKNGNFFNFPKNRKAFSLFFYLQRPRKFRETKISTVCAEIRAFANEKIRHSCESGKEIKFEIPANFMRKLNLNFPHFFAKNEVKARICLS